MTKASVWTYSGTLPLAALMGLTLPSPPAVAQGLAIYARTPTGQPETLFDTDPADAVAQVVDRCLAEGLTVVAKDDAAVTCQVPDDREAGARLDLGRAGQTGRPIFYRFQVEERGDTARVLAGGWEESVGFWGGTQEREFTDPAFHNALIDLMVQAGGRLPPGTRFPNHAMIGADFVARERPEQSLEVTSVEADSPAMRAGLQVGDLVTRIANRRTRTMEDLNRSLVDAASASRFEIHFLREGREGVALLRSEFRPAVTAPMLAEAEEAPVEEAAIEEPVQTLSASAPPASAVPAAAMQFATTSAMAPPYAAAPYAATPAMMPFGISAHPMPQPYGAFPAVPQGAILRAASAPAPTAAAPAQAGSSFSVADELVKFAALLKEGVITQAEFDAQKARLLAQ